MALRPRFRQISALKTHANPCIPTRCLVVLTRANLAKSAYLLSLYAFGPVALLFHIHELDGNLFALQFAQSGFASARRDLGSLIYHKVVRYAVGSVHYHQVFVSVT